DQGERAARIHGEVRVHNEEVRPTPPPLPLVAAPPAKAPPPAPPRCLMRFFETKTLTPFAIYCLLAEQPLPPTSSPQKRSAFLQVDRVARRVCFERSATMEHFWSRAGANGHNQPQHERGRRRLKRDDRQPSAARGNLPSFDGNEGVDGFESVRGL